MQWLQDEKMKHRIIGLAVLLSIALVFLPAMIKKSNQRLDRRMSLALKMPKKPSFPTVEAVKSKVLLNTVQVAHVKLPAVSVHPKEVVTARAESISGVTISDRSVIQKMPVIAHANLKHTRPNSRDLAVAHIEQKVHSVQAKAQQKGNVFAVQLASFSQREHALSLVNTLQKKGFEASYEKQGQQYRVLVGQLSLFEDAQHLQKTLTAKTQMTGLIVKVG